MGSVGPVSGGPESFGPASVPPLLDELPLLLLAAPLLLLVAPLLDELPLPLLAAPLLDAAPLELPVPLEPLVLPAPPLDPPPPFRTDSSADEHAQTIRPQPRTAPTDRMPKGVARSAPRQMWAHVPRSTCSMRRGGGSAPGERDPRRGHRPATAVVDQSPAYIPRTWGTVW